MKLNCTILLFASLFAGSVAAYSVSNNNNNNNSDRRTFLTKSIGTASLIVAATATGGGGGASLMTPPNAYADVTGPDADGFFETDSGLKYKVTKQGSGGVPSPGQTVKAHYTGWLDGFDSPKKFDSSRDRGRPFTFSVGRGQVIRGWDESFSSMAVGERRQIIIPSRLGYGDRGAGGIIPPGAKLYFGTCGFSCLVVDVMLLCCCLLPCMPKSSSYSLKLTHTHTHTHTQMSSC